MSNLISMLAEVHWSFWVIRVGILTQFAKPIKLTLIGTCLIFYGTFKSHESHCNKHIFMCYRRPVTEWSFCMHSYNQIYHYGSIACLGVEIRLQMKKLWGKRCFYTVFSGMLLLQCDIKNTGIFCSNLASCNAAKFFLVSFFGMRYLEKIFTATSEVCFKANSLNTVWNLTKCYSVTFLDLGRTSSWQGKRLKIHLQCDHFCFLKSPSRKSKCPAFISTVRCSYNSCIQRSYHPYPSHI